MTSSVDMARQRGPGRVGGRLKRSLVIRLKRAAGLYAYRRLRSITLEALEWLSFVWLERS